MRDPARRLRHLPFVLAFAAACGAAEGTRWQALARETAELTRSQPVLEIDGKEFRFVHVDTGDWLETRLAGSEWSPSSEAGRWSVPLLLRRTGRAPDGSSPLRLESTARRFEDFADEWSGGEDVLPPGSFIAVGERLYLQLEDGEDPPEEATLAYSVLHTRAERGAWRVDGRRFTGEGFSVWPGSKLEVPLAIPAASALTLATCTEPARPSPANGEEHVFRVFLDDHEIFSHAQPLRDEGSFAWHTIAFPPGGVRRARLRFEVDGPFAYTAFLAPFVGPADVGTYGARPWEEAAPDIVVFLADTFRADNMGAYGGELGLTPHLDELARESLRFSRAWSVSTHTLPVHASLFAGLYPHQMGVRGRGTRLPEALETVAELLARHDYRTGAISDSGMVSQFFGLAQGFQWFDELRSDLGSSLKRARAFLDADDGRPVFLFVQTYRVHSPYTVTEATRRERTDLGIDGTYKHWNEILQAEVGPDPTPEGREALERLEALYLGGVVDFDRGFERFCRDLERIGLLENGYLLFTSDHGEAFGEHDEIKHSGPVYEEQVRVPLLIHGGGLPARQVDHAASIVDLAPTIADMAGVRPHPAWLGTSLLSLDRDRPVFLFQCKPQGAPSTVGFVEGPYKVMGHEDAAEISRTRFGAAFDLERDPAEIENLLDGEAAWPEELWRRLAPAAEGLLRPVVDSASVHLDPEHAAELRALGYGGED